MLPEQVLENRLDGFQSGCWLQVLCSITFVYQRDCNSWPKIQERHIFNVEFQHARRAKKSMGVFLQIQKKYLLQMLSDVFLNADLSLNMICLESGVAYC